MGEGRGAAGGDGAARIDEYLAALDPAPRATLERVRATLARVVPHAEERISYGLPAVALDGKAVAGYAAFAGHCSYFPMSGSVLEAAGEAVDGYTISKGGLQFPVGGRLPVALVRRLVRLRLDELAAVRNGRRTDYFDDGGVKATGQMKDGQLHGNWTWYRQDGTVSRVGRFARGEQVGTWETYDRDGTLVRTVTD